MSSRKLPAEATVSVRPESRITVRPETDLDVDFEPLVLRAMLHSAGFLQRHRSLVAPELFRDPGRSYLAGLVLAFYDEYRETPAKPVLVDLVRRSDYRDRGTLANFVDEAAAPDNASYIEDRLLEWARWTRINAVIAADDRSDPLRFASRVQQAARTGDAATDGVAIMSAESNGDLTEIRRPCVPTPWGWLNSRMLGGPEYQDFVVIESFINVGKTSLLVNVGGAGLCTGEIVCYGTFEDGEVKIRRRFTQYITGTTIDDLIQRPEQIGRQVKEFFEQTNSALYIKRLRSRRSTVEDFAAFVRTVEDKTGRKVRLAISDYMDRYAAPSLRRDPRHEYREIAEECKLMAADEDLVHWSATQSNRITHNKDVVGLEHVGESLGKVEGADAVLGAGQNAEDVQTGTINLFTAKLRDHKKHESLRLVAELDKQRIWDPNEEQP